MATAPTYTQWGSEVSSNSKVGLAIVETQTASQVTLTIETWLFTKSKVTDSGNSYVFTYTNDSGSTATSTKSNLSISTGTNFGQKLNTHTLTYTRGSSDKEVTLKVELKEIGTNSYTCTKSTTYRIAGKPNYTISYNGNAGVAPSATTGTYGASTSAISLPTTTRPGHSFVQWYMNLTGSNTINLGRSYRYTDKFSFHIEAYQSTWSLGTDVPLASCTQSGGWSLYNDGDGYVKAIAYDAGVGYKAAKASTL